jgi:serine/threonine protein kinase
MHICVYTFKKVDEYGVVKLSDFGLSRRIPSAPSNQTSSSTNAAANNNNNNNNNNGGSGGGNGSGPRKKGTPFYMAPELFLEDGVHSYKSELWSLGCMLFELYVGKPPWTSSSLNELIRSILHDPFEFPPELNVTN